MSEGDKGKGVEEEEEGSEEEEDSESGNRQKEHEECRRKRRWRGGRLVNSDKINWKAEEE